MPPIASLAGHPCVMLAALPSLLHGQSARVIRGTVLAESDSAPVAEAIIRRLGPVSERRTWSSGSGRFELTAPGGEIRLLVTRIGYVPDTR